MGWTTNLTSLVGKTIEAAGIDSEVKHAPDSILLKFTDGTVAQIDSSEWITGLVVEGEGEDG